MKTLDAEDATVMLSNMIFMRRGESINGDRVEFQNK